MFPFGGGAFGGGMGGGTFESNYRCYPVSFIDKASAENGDKVFLPPSALDRLSQLSVEYPMLFEITNPAVGRKSHCGVLEFIAEEGMVYLPYWMMTNMALSEGDLVHFRNVSLPKGTYVKIQPHTSDFLDITNPKAVLERTLRQYTCLTVGDHFCVNYNSKRYEIEVKAAKPADAVSVVETDCQVDFEAPKDYKEPPRVAPKPIPVEEKPEPEPEPEPEPAKDHFHAFAGAGNRLDGRAASSSASPVAVDLSKLGATIRKYDWNPMADDEKKVQKSTGSNSSGGGDGRKAGTMMDTHSNRLQAKLAKQKAGAASAPPPKPPKEEKKEEEEKPSGFAAFKGKPNTLR